jgi:oxygen-independent coproporphyrinogen-3 oxidase
MGAPSGPAPSAEAFDDGRVGVYVHLPYCERICPYCDFAVVAARSLARATEDRYVDAIRRELDARRDDFADRTLASIYLGGGTPSLFHPDRIAALIESIEAAFPTATPEGAPAIERTLELNPSSVERARLPGFREAGVDRLSIGVQSFDDTQLKRLGRAHRADVARETLRAARAAGFENLSLDLMFAGPGQTESDVDRDLDELIDWRPEHVSTYELTFEPATPFGRALAAGRIEACREDRAVRMIERIETRLAEAGYERYEISSHARPGYRSRHNARYWQRQAVLGLGMGAHSFEARSAARPHGARRANPRELETWLVRVARSPATVGEEETLPLATALGEAVFLALRQREGLSARRFAAEFGGAPRDFFADAIEETVRRGWVEESVDATGDLRLTAAGRLFADSVAMAFVGEG